MLQNIMLDQLLMCMHEFTDNGMAISLDWLLLTL